jgi:hypothetical protein
MKELLESVKELNKMTKETDENSKIRNIAYKFDELARLFKFTVAYMGYDTKLTDEDIKVAKIRAVEILYYLLSLFDLFSMDETKIKKMINAMIIQKKQDISINEIA